MLNRRIHILFDDNLWLQLCALAKVRETSVGELVRKAVKGAYFQENKKIKMTKAMETILKIRKKLKKVTAEEIKEMINYGRKY